MALLCSFLLFAGWYVSSAAAAAVAIICSSAGPHTDRSFLSQHSTFSRELLFYSLSLFLSVCALQANHIDSGADGLPLLGYNIVPKDRP
jgi:hypothetical protein